MLSVASSQLGDQRTVDDIHIYRNTTLRPPRRFRCTGR